ncbi:MAG: class I SAM-dependent methyltransferase [Kiritimatiellae bacterium]|nr:class I SAM-dependent methyltransferase [Kiritimatiellia bacterium]
MNGRDEDAAVMFPETADIATSSDDYARRFSGPVGEWFLEKQEKIVLLMIPLDRSLSILDVGGGHGQLAIPLCRQGYTVTVVGSHPSCAARLAPAVATGRCLFHVANVLALPFREREFDVVLCFRLLPHCSKWEALVAELARVARGSVIVDFPVAEGLNRLATMFFGIKKLIEKNTRHWRQFHYSDVCREFKRHGLHVAISVRQFFWPMALHRALNSLKVSRTLEGFAGRLGLTRRWGSPVILKMIRR